MTPFALAGLFADRSAFPLFSMLTAASPLLLHNKRILVVDDVEEERLLLIDFLRQQQCRVYIAEDGEDAYAKAQILKPDLILMDIHMPVLDGLGACRLLKANRNTRTIPLIFLTAAVLPHERVAGLTAGAVDYIVKPFDFEEVRLRLCIHMKTGKNGHSPVVAAADSASPPSRPDTVLFEAARRLMLEQLGNTLAPAVLAKAIGTNPRRLNVAFRSCAGMTVFEYLREARMKQACRLLSETGLDIQVIASELGYNNAANFSTAFRERFGTSPSAFRQDAEKTDQA